MAALVSGHLQMRGRLYRGRCVTLWQNRWGRSSWPENETLLSERTYIYSEIQIIQKEPKAENP